jgi:hypothetical protein
VKPDETSREERLETAWKGVGEAVTKLQNLKSELASMWEFRGWAHLTASAGGGVGIFMATTRGQGEAMAQRGVVQGGVSSEIKRVD